MYLAPLHYILIVNLDCDLTFVNLVYKVHLLPDFGDSFVPHSSLAEGLVLITDQVLSLNMCLGPGNAHRLDLERTQKNRWSHLKI